MSREMDPSLILDAGLLCSTPTPYCADNSGPTKRNRVYLKQNSEVGTNRVLCNN